jgi:hypothetical protein
MRQELHHHPVRNRYIMALTISLLLYLAGLPPFLGAGTRDPHRCHCSPVASAAYGRTFPFIRHGVFLVGWISPCLYRILVIKSS